MKNKDIYPTDSVLSEQLGTIMPLWKQFLDVLNSDPLITYEWRYYTDGNLWLFKVVRKKKTVFWTSVLSGSFNVTSYISIKAEDAVLNSDLNNEDKEQYLNNKIVIKNKAVTVNVKTEKDIDRIRKLLALRTSIK